MSKGSKSRVSDVKKYKDNYDKIFKNIKKQKSNNETKNDKK